MEIYNKWQKPHLRELSLASKGHSMPSPARCAGSPPRTLASETPLVRRVKQQFSSRGREFLRERLGGGTLTRSVRAEF